MKLSVIKNKVGATTKEVHNKDLAKFITTNDYSLITFEDNYRKAKNFKEAEAFGLDFDDGMTIGTAVKAFKDYKHIIAPTPVFNIHFCIETVLAKGTGQNYVVTALAFRVAIQSIKDNQVAAMFKIFFMTLK